MDTSSPLVSTLLFAYCLCLNFFLAATNITTTRFLNNSETILSSNGRFKMGFFNPSNSTNRYVGIWYNIKDSDSEEVVWVANKNNPVNDSSGVLKISVDGNLQLLDGQHMVLWSPNVSHEANTTVAELRDTGNLVLLSSASGKIVWQSFEHLTNALLPQTTISINLSINQYLGEDEFAVLRSWKSTSDPSEGRFKVRLTPSLNTTEFVVLKDDRPYWRTGPWNGSKFLGIPYMAEEMFHILYEDTENTVDVIYSPANESLLEHMGLNYDGSMVLKKWDDDSQNMITFWRSIQSGCDIFGTCGPFGRCNSRDSPICNCLNGFQPKNAGEWSKGNWTSGCVRMTPLQCGNTGVKADGFLRLQHMKLPFYISFPFANNAHDCRQTCLEKCTCLAYAYPEGTYHKSNGCMIWEVNLIDIQVFSGDGADLFIRLAHSELAEMSNSNTKKIVIAVTVAVAAVIFVGFAYCFWSPIYGLCVKKSTYKEMKFLGAGVDQAEFKDLTLFEFKELEFATTNFSEFNKLGEGGFGSVYKGKLENGQEIAVKRLSRTSGQGLQEFMNEVLVISKLQHKNLVILLGCCVERDEKLLVYEFMPNKSLDALLFDSHYRKQLDWKRRLNIINGICRGLLYLHRDSRLKIIHRDLKPSNILLDGELSPKISDFGMARIFETKQNQANTLKVVGTYGYMSPEYAMEGHYSEKSDVYSLGVLLLEIVSGRKNSSFRNYESLGLLAHTWKLWNENDTHSLIDPAILDPRFKDEILKCIQLGLLSVQENPKDRPTASALVSMLDVNDIMELPHPTQPGFIQMNACSSKDILGNIEEQGSVNHVSLTAVSGR